MHRFNKTEISFNALKGELMGQQKDKEHNEATLNEVINERSYSSCSKKNIIGYFFWFLAQIMYLSIFYFFCKNKLYMGIFAFLIILVGFFVIGSRLKESRFKKIILQQTEEIRKLKSSRDGVV